MVKVKSISIGKCFITLLLVTFMLMVVGCSNETVTNEVEADTGAEVEETDGEAAPSAGNSVELRISHFVSPQHGQHTKVFEPFSEEVAELTEGRVTASIYPGAALGAPTAQYDMATTGVADITYAIQGYTPGKFPLSSVVELPFVAENAEKATSILWDLYNEFPEIQEEYKENKVLWLFGIDNDQILTTNKEIKTVEDLRGLKISTPSPASNAVVEAWGAIPVFMPMNEVYEAMQRGIVDGRLGPYSAVANFKLNEVTGYITEGDFYTTNFAITMNKQAWESLSEADQEAINGLLDKYRDLAAAVYSEDAELGKKAALDSGVEVTELSEDVKAEFKEALDPIHEAWVQEMDGDGLPGLQVYEEAMRLSDQYE
ncbi:TRAP-T extracellular binding protein [Alkalihalophilus pseudofirmus OF4]|uniref:TRAP-T extracellular binding protein n=2 Tax=Alkalihalophilus pseudofirmus TaxID=79885 RepID=D3FWS9_ALKPO|nr:TRAP transporter substrate-binding protein [Alkalihalophilus pseudofirmus]ADC50577.1 TRAP-T extracellular binding protein [Alkalihalophilus pseudofirmus OF4]MDV2883726.1 TRAP transporter substrate-binding protein [Alkalihalophilus pseudofirmus]